MLTSLHIQNLAIVDDVAVDFSPGLNLLTGETGSGKSILVDGLALLFGTRASADLVRSGETSAQIQGEFTLTGNDDLARFLDERGVPAGDGELILRREISLTGRTRSFLNDQIVTASLLKQLRSFLLEIHAQGEQQSLLSPDQHLEMLDSFAELAELRACVENCFHEYSRAKQALDEMAVADSDRLREIDLLRFQVAEIERLNPDPTEEELLRAERDRLRNGEQIGTLAREAYGLLYDEEQAAVSQIGKAVRRLISLSAVDPTVSTLATQAESVKSELQDLASSLGDYLHHLDVAPGRLAAIEDRLAELESLKRKYGQGLDAVLLFLSTSRARLDLLIQIESARAERQQVVSEKSASFLKGARELSAKRVRAASGFEKRIVGELKDLALKDCVVRMEVRTPNQPVHESTFTSRGIDRVEMLISANAGEPPRPIASVVSGGELSRVMLAIKTVCTPSRYPRSLVFDEIDSGIGGRIAELVGRRLIAIAKSNQVLCVTHQPQIARFASAHFAVRKVLSNGRARVEVTRVEGVARVEELARMLGGATITPTAIKHAKELLAS